MRMCKVNLLYGKVIIYADVYDVPLWCGRIFSRITEILRKKSFICFKNARNTLRVVKLREDKKRQKDFHDCSYWSRSFYGGRSYRN